MCVSCGHRSVLVWSWLQCIWGTSRQAALPFVYANTSPPSTACDTGVDALLALFLGPASSFITMPSKTSFL